MVGRIGQRTGAVPGRASENTGESLSMRLIRILGIVVAGVVLLVAGLAGAGVLWLRTSLPVLDGEQVVRGLEAPVEILRDAHGIPTIRAANAADAALALGFVHAQDRFGQMEMMRRMGSGRMAELIGGSGLRFDRYFRGLGLYRQAAGQEDMLPPDLRRRLQAYAAGVNAWLGAHDGAMPWLVALLLYDPEPWRVTDSLLWGRMMAFHLLGNWRSEALRARLSERLNDRQIADLWPEDVGSDPPPTLSIESAGGSNVWAVADPPGLANDPHLGLAIPGVWYLARIETPDRVLAGATAPGVPLMVLGHNGVVAWGLTNATTDVSDIVLRPDIVSRRTETFAVRWGDPVTAEVRTTGAGVVLSDLSARYPEGWALETPTLREDDRTVLALDALNAARSWRQFEQALADFHSPHQNVAYADATGRIGMISPARVPLRETASGFTVSERRAWERLIPYHALPRTVNPPSGRLVNANNRLFGPEYPYFMGREWKPSWRARRITMLLEQGAEHAAIQMDTISLSARALLPHLLAVVPEPDLAAWDGDMDRNRHEPLLYMAWVRELLRGIFADELGPQFRKWWSYRVDALIHVLTRRPAWCDDITTDGEETCDAQVREALRRARDLLTERFGSDTAPWGAAHAARFAHPLAARIPVLRDLIEREIPASGGPTTVSRGDVRLADEAHPFRQVHGSGYRAIYDLRDLEQSRFMQAVGQSGNPFSPHYDDLMELWRDGAYLRLTAPDHPVHTLRLVPG